MAVAFILNHLPAEDLRKNYFAGFATELRSTFSIHQKFQMLLQPFKLYLNTNPLLYKVLIAKWIVNRI